MALTITPDLTLQDAAENSGTWTRSHSVAQAQVITDTDFFLQGSASVAWQTKTTGPDHGMAWDKGTANIDLSNTILRMWIQMNESNKYETKANGGVRIFVSDGAFGADNWGEWYVHGSDTLTADWINVVIDTNTPFDRTSTTAPTMTTIRRIGLTTNMVTKPAKVQNCHVDVIRTGRGLTITGTVTDVGKGWQEIASDDQLVANQYGVLQRAASGVLVCTGEIKFGSTATASLDFSDDQNEKIVFPKGLSGHLDGLYNIIIQGNGTGSTNFRLGKVIGTGNDRQGILGGNIFALGARWGFDAETDSSDIDSCNIYGTSFEGGGNLKFAGPTTQDLIGCDFISCDEVQVNDADMLNCRIISPSPDRGLEFTANTTAKQMNFIAGSTDDQPVTKAWQVDVSATPDAFVDLTTDINDAGTGDVLPFPASEASGDYFAIGFRGKFSQVKIDTGTARSGGTLVWEYETGSGWSSLTPTFDGTNTLSTTGLQNVDFVPPTDWSANSIAIDSGINSEIPNFYLRLRVTATMGTNPIIDQAFIANTVEHHVHIPSSNTYSFVDMIFSGHSPAGGPKWHGENSSNANVIINASGTSNPAENEFDETGGTGDSTQIINTKVLTLDTLRINSEVRILDTNKTILDGIEASEAPIGSIGVVSQGDGYAISDTLTLSGGTFSTAATATPTEVRPIDAQTEANYNNSPTTEGTFVGGTNYTISDTITLNDGTTITVDGETFGVVEQFTVDTSTTTSNQTSDGVTLTQSSTSGSGTGFTLTLDQDNQRLMNAELVTGGSYTVYPTSPISHTGGSGTGATFSVLTEGTGSFPYTYNFVPDTTVTIMVFHLNFKQVRFNTILQSTNQTIPIQQEVDRSYLNPS